MDSEGSALPVGSETLKEKLIEIHFPRIAAGSYRVGWSPTLVEGPPKQLGDSMYFGGYGVDGIGGSREAERRNPGRHGWTAERKLT
jgi:hypothetical protein